MIRSPLAVLVVVGLAGCARDDTASVPAQEPVHSVAPIAPIAPVARPPAKAKPPRPAQLTHVTIKALGMYCEESCPIAVRSALAAFPAIYELGFDLTNESIFVSYDAALGSAKQVTAPMLVAIKGVGFDPWLAKDSWPADVDAQVVAR